MNPQERQLIDGLFDRLSQVAGAPQDAEAAALISLGQQRVPNATYTLVQTVLLQDEALRQMNERIEELERAAAAAPAAAPASTGFLDSMRSSVFGQNGRGSVPSVQPGGGAQTRPTWNTGELLNQPPQQGAPGGAFGGGGPGGQPQQAGAPARGGSFLGTAAAAAAGVVGGSLLMNSLGSMFGGNRANAQGLGDSATKGAGETQSPWSSGAGDSSLAKDAGVGDVGSANNAQRSFDDQQSGYQNASDNEYDDGDEDEYGDDDFDDGFDEI